MIVIKYFTVGLIVMLLNPHANNFYEVGQSKTKVVYVTFLSEFNDELEIYVNGKLLKSDKFVTEPSVGACLNDFKINFFRNSKNTIAIRRKDGKVLFEFETPRSADEKYLYISRNFGQWSFTMERNAIEME